jgi:hypothetical protein
MRWHGHVACIERLKNVYKTQVEYPEGRQYMGVRQQLKIKGTVFEVMAGFMRLKTDDDLLGLE